MWTPPFGKGFYRSSFHALMRKSCRHTVRLLWRQVILLCCSTVKPVTSRLPTVQISAGDDRPLSVSAWNSPGRADLSSVVRARATPLDGQGRRKASRNGFFRMYNETTTDIRRGPIASASTSSTPWRRGIGSHFQDPVQAGEWIHPSSASPMRRQPRFIRTACSAIATVTAGSGSGPATIIRRAFG